jgi:hypothetical protein
VRVDNCASPELVAQLVREALEKGATVEIDGLGTFARDGRHGFVFRGKQGAKVFIAYVLEDAALAERLFDAFAAEGFAPWLDRRKLLPGQNWPRAIDHAMETADFVVMCFSAHAVRKKGGFQAEVRYALDCAARVPLDEIFLVPIRLDDCRVPAQIQKFVQYVDLFPDFEAGLRRILRILKAECHRRSL